MSALSDPDNLLFVIEEDEPTDSNGLTDAEFISLFNLPGGVTPNAVKNLTAAAGEEQTGAMIALVPSDPDSLALPTDVDGAEAADQLHLTLWFLGEGADYDEETRSGLVDAVTSMIKNRAIGPVTGNAFGVNHWNPISDASSWVLAVGDLPRDEREGEGYSLAEIRESMREAWFDGGLTLDLPPQHTPWVPHVCLAYSDDTMLAGTLIDRLGLITFDTVRLAFAGEVFDVPLGDEEDTSQESFDRGSTLPATDLTTAVTGEVTVPWHKERDNTDCGDGEIAVVADDDDSVVGCHDSEADADDQLAALNANENAAGEVEELGGKPNPGTDRDRRLKRNSKKKKTGYAADVEADGQVLEMDGAFWSGPLVVEGVTTGDGREFATDSLKWADPPLPLRWNKEDSHGGAPTTVAVNVGRIDHVWRDDDKIMGSGVFNLAEEDGRRAYALVKDQFLRGVSIDADDIGDADIEMVWPERPEDAEVDEAEDMLMMLFGRPEKTIFHGGRIRAATLCDIPAFVEAYVELNDEAVTPPDVPTHVEGAAVVPEHVTATTDSSWDGNETEQRLTPVLMTDVARAAFALVPCTDVTVRRTECRFLHHEVNSEGTIGAANLTACAAGIGALQSGRSVGLTLTERRGVYDHLAAHLRLAGREPPPFTDRPIAATLLAHVTGDDWRPPLQWFQDPKLSQLVPIIVDDAGRVYGHAAQWGECHLGYGDSCIVAPREQGHPYFMTGEVVCADGTHVPVGQIFTRTAHAGLWASPNRATEHYDNTGYAVADVAVGNDRHGIWVAGSVRPDAVVTRVNELRASGQLSPDWRRIGGQLRMVGLLVVNVSGFQVPRPKARVFDGEVQALVAAGVVPIGGAASVRAERRALDAVVAQLRVSVHGGT